MIATAKRVGLRFVPTKEIFISCAIDLGTAVLAWVGLWLFEPYLHEWIVKLGHFGVHVLILMAIWNPIQHARRVYHQHVKRAAALALEFATHTPRLEGGPEACPVCQECGHTDELDWSPWDGTRTFACGFGMNTEGMRVSACSRSAAS